MKGVETLSKLQPADQSTVDVSQLEQHFHEAMNDDLSTPMVISTLFDWVRIINQAAAGQQSFTATDLDRLKALFQQIVFDVLGLKDEKNVSTGGNDLLAPVVDLLLEIRAGARERKEWATCDAIRDRLAAIGIRVKDRKDGCDWEIE